MKDTMTIEFNKKRVANLLKTMVNQMCEDGFLWYPDVSNEMPTLFDVNAAIIMLESAETTEIKIIDDTQED